ncbi:MAG: ABC transporter ATP-binding protein [Desulfobacterales bacterium]|jgi:ABC-type multidrug transport system fused ATPase/permease subunit
MPEDSISGDRGYGSLKANLKNLSPYFKHHWRRGMFGCVLIAAAALLALPPPLITRYLVDDVILGRQLSLLTGAILLLIGCLVAEKLARLLEDFYFARFEQNITLDIQQDLIDRVLHFPRSFFDDKQTGYLHSRLNDDVDGMRWFFSSTIVHVISNVLRLFGGIVFLFYLEWRLAIAVLFLLPGLGWMIRFFSGRIHILSHQAMEHKANASGHFQESLSGASLVKAYANENRTSNHLMSSFRKVFKISLEQRAINSLAGLSINAMPGLARIMTLALLAFQAYLAYVFGPAQFLASSNLQFQKALAALERVSAIFDIAPEDNREDGRKVGKLKGDIEFKNVCFGYNGYELVLKDISLHIRAGERLALVGPSGIGKTTLMSLLLRFYRTASGEIYFDGLPAKDYNTDSLRKRIGYASQEPKILTGTVMENLRYGDPDAGRAQIVKAARISAIHDDIQNLPQGYETVIGKKGLNLSEGQKQRLSLARALVKDPDILILDEPTSALDSMTEKSIFDALPSQINGKTVLVASHRISTIMQANRIVLLNESGVADIGTHESLIESSDYYRSIAHYQN